MVLFLFQEYIIAMCQPGETYQLPFDNKCREFLNEENLEEIEKQTNACIDLGDKNIVLIKGSELAVTLAISSLENIIGDPCIETDGVNVEGTQKDGKGLPPSDWEKRLDSTFIRALSSNSDGTCKFDDYHNSSAEVKMTILKCLNNELSDNVDEDELFEESLRQMAGSSLLHPIHIFGDEGEDLNAVSKSESKQNIDQISEQLSDSNITIQDTSSKKTEETDDVKFLRTFGTSAGYSNELIDSGLMYIDDKTAPCDFLDILKQLKEQSNNGDRTESPMEVDIPSTSSSNFFKDFPPPPIVDSDLEKARRSLPKEYKQTLVKHMIEEEKGEMSVTDLKKQNEERQKILKERFEGPSPQSSPRGENSRRKKKNRKKQKSNKKLGQNNNIVEGESRDGDDEEETCVLKLGDSSEEDCIITGVEDSQLPVVAVVKPSSPRHPPPQRPSFVPPEKPLNHRQSHFTRDTALTQRQSNCPSDNYIPFNSHIISYEEELDGPRELRYIVIDGSNVAMQ